jgi:hypothetical protein
MWALVVVVVLLLRLVMVVFDLVQNKLYFVEFSAQLVVEVELIGVEMMRMRQRMLDWIEMMMDAVVH